MTKESDVRADFEALSITIAKALKEEPILPPGLQITDARADFENTSKAVVGKPVEQNIPIPEPKQG